ncbi:hypothetical protein E3V39_12630 [Gammaproteobacteria bacterium LSUCC0112]|nr:hypothetical protein E3V39_12630 [Gammaproteobacteria bacterium LSUCC0112]
MKSLYENVCFVALLIFAGSSFASENPLYSDASSRLTIRAVDAGNKPGIFQDVVIEHAKDDLWRLVGMREGVLLPHIDTVELVKTSNVPVQVFLKISGQFPHGCGAIGEISQKKTDNTFVISVYFKNDLWLQNPLDVACTLAIRPFSHIIPLPAYGLPAGNYEYRLNEKFSGVFSLNADNVLTE